MRLIIIGTLNGQIGAATRIALQRGAKVAQVEDIDQALNTLRAERGADLALIDVGLDVRRLVDSLKEERFNQIGRESWRERMCAYVSMTVVCVSLKKKIYQNKQSDTQ